MPFWWGSCDTFLSLHTSDRIKVGQFFSTWSNNLGQFNKPLSNLQWGGLPPLLGEGGSLAVWGRIHLRERSSGC